MDGRQCESPLRIQFLPQDGLSGQQPDRWTAQDYQLRKPPRGSLPKTGLLTLYNGLDAREVLLQSRGIMGIVVIGASRTIRHA